MTYLDPQSCDLLGVSHPPSKAPAPAGLRVPAGAGGERAIAGDAYEGASHFSREMAMWQPPMRSADNDILPQKRTGDLRVRDTLRNDAYIRGGSTLHKDNIVGGMFMLNAKPATKVLLGKEDEAFETEFQEETETKFTLWAESPDNWPDAQRINTFTGLVRLAVATYVAAGEILGAVEWIRDWEGMRPYNTAIQMLDLDRLSTPPNLMGNRNIRGGIEKNIFGAPQAYHIRRAHPNDSWSNADAWLWKRVPVRKPWGRLQIIHIFEQDRPDQTRGISEMVAALKEMRQTKDFREIVLQNAVVNATFAASIESDLDTDAIFARLGGGNLGEDLDAAIRGYVTGYLGMVSEYIGDKKQFQIGGTRIPHLPPGSKLQLRPAGQGGPLGTDFEQSLLRYIAANLGVSYEQLSRDYTRTNYSSARAAMSETWKFMLARKKMVADRFATIIYRLWLEESLNKGLIESLPRKFRQRNDAAWLYEGQNFDAISACDWIGASRGQIDELKETQAAVLRLKYNLSTHEEELSRLGKDWRAGFRQKAREKKMQTDLDIVPDQADNSINAASGSPQQREAKDEKSDGSDNARLMGGSVDQLFLDAAEERADA
ncbi:phage portal protein [Bosea vestrisii]|uniref:Phage portal protein n=1 Tax=Bosea vestrisii TaxID=151416 RepID=A0ABW0HB75_9HYPH